MPAFFFLMLKGERIRTMIEDHHGGLHRVLDVGIRGTCYRNLPTQLALHTGKSEESGLRLTLGMTDPYIQRTRPFHPQSATHFMIQKVTAPNP